MKTIELAGVTFEYHKSKMHPVAPINGYNYDEIYEVYDRPSNYKVEIWHEWFTWVDDMRKDGWKCGIEIAGHNGFCFTIIGSARKDNITYDLWMTRDHNRAYQYND